MYMQSHMFEIANSCMQLDSFHIRAIAEVALSCIHSFQIKTPGTRLSIAQNMQSLLKFHISFI